MRAEYKRDMSHNYLILHGENPVDTSSYQVRMLTGNAVPCILKCRIQGLDGKFLFYYDITSKQSLDSFYEQRKLCREDLEMIMTSFIRVMEEMGEFLLDATGRKNGRGAYLCPDSECLAKAVKNKGLERSFKQAIPKEVYEALEKEMEVLESE